MMEMDFPIALGEYNYQLITLQFASVKLDLSHLYVNYVIIYPWCKNVVQNPF